MRQRVRACGRRRTAARSPRRWPRGWRRSCRAPPTIRRPRSRRSSIRASRRGISRSDRRRPAGARRRGRDRALPSGPAARRSATAARTCCRRSSTARRRRIRSRIASSCFRSRRSSTSRPRRWRRCPTAWARRWSVTALTRRPGADRSAARLGSHRPPQPRPDSDEHDRLGPAARGQSVRAPLRAARVSAGRVAIDRCMRLLYLTAGAAEMYCGSCLRDNALAAALLARGHDVVLHADLHADDDRREERQRVARVLRRRQRVPRAARAAVPAHAGVSRSALGLDAGAEAGLEATDQGRSRRCSAR